MNEVKMLSSRVILGVCFGFGSGTAKKCSKAYIAGTVGKSSSLNYSATAFHDQTCENRCRII